ncbi:MAG: hypothetical protein M1133_13845 [Armatimonadetes bacterium]|nr:hypothetical protein [Armatimonadota bacterium]
MVSEVANANAEVVLNLVLGADERTEGMMPGWDIELARQRLLFFTKPADFGMALHEAAGALDAAFAEAATSLRERMISFMLGVAESLLSPVELHHNLQNAELHGCPCCLLPDDLASGCQKMATDMVKKWAGIDGIAFLNVTALIKAEDLSVNKGDNLFAGWARKWSGENGGDPYANADNYLSCFGALYQRGMYYPDLYFAREEGKTKTQFFNDYGLQAARCRRMGSLGGTTNPAIAVMGEDDMSGKANIWGQEATDYILKFRNKWHEVRKIIAKEQIAEGKPDDWGATKFTEWVVVDAMLGLRSIFLLKGLGRVAFQLRPDWHDDEKKLTYAGGEIYDILCRRVNIFDDILLDGAADVYREAAEPRVGISNNHFKISCTGQPALNVIRSFNAGHSPAYPDALRERMFTNVTLSYEVPQMYASSMAIENGIRDYEKRTGEKVDDGEGGSVVTSMIGRFNDAIRDYRVKALLAALPESSEFKSVAPASVKKLTEQLVNNPEFIAAVKAAGIDFDPASEEDAIDRAGTLCTKRVVVLLEKNEGLARTRILTASKRNFFQNTELLDVPFSTDFGNIQRMYMDVMPLKIDNWKTILDDMDANGCPKPGTIWAKRHETLSRIWPDWPNVFEADTVKPEDYATCIYVVPTLTQFIGFWNENCARAKRFADEARA